MNEIYKTEVLIIGAGAAGLMCASQAAKRGRKVLLIDHANKAGKKILMSGGGRCNFTNYTIGPENYLSHNQHFFKSALAQYSQWDFIALVDSYNIPYHEKKHGQLFCDNKAKDILELLLNECSEAGVELRLNESIQSIEQLGPNHFKLQGSAQNYSCQSLVIATGGLSIPTMGSSPFGYKVAAQFDIPVWPTRAGLVPFTLDPKDKDRLNTLAGVSSDSQVSTQRQSFREQILFTHRGLSGPAILQLSSYWQPGTEIKIDLIPELVLIDSLKKAQQESPKLSLSAFFAPYLAKRIINIFLGDELEKSQLGTFSFKQLAYIASQFQDWRLKPSGTEGYRTAEVTLGGVDCNALSSKTMEAKAVSGLYFIGEVVDVTGWLGGFNFQWAWSSGWTAGQVV